MNLKLLTTEELDAQVKSLHAKNKDLLFETLHTLKEVHARRMYLELGYSNLYQYLMEEIGWEGASAQRRIDAVNLMMEVPAVSEKIRSGEISLNKVSMLQRSLRESKHVHKKLISARHKKELVDLISDKSLKEAQRDVAQYLDIPVIQPTIETAQADDSVRIEFTVSKELYQQIREAQALLSHAIGRNDIVSYLNYVTQRVIKQKTKIREKSSTAPGSDLLQKTKSPWVTIPVATTNTEANSEHEGDLPNDKISPKGKTAYSRNESARHNSSFSARQKKIALNNTTGCQFVGPSSGKQCGSHWFLQADHIRSIWADGTSDSENIQLLCGAHNRMKYRKEANIRSTS